MDQYGFGRERIHQKGLKEKDWMKKCFKVKKMDKKRALKEKSLSK